MPTADNGAVPPQIMVTTWKVPADGLEAVEIYLPPSMVWLNDPRPVLGLLGGSKRNKAWRSTNGRGGYGETPEVSLSPRSAWCRVGDAQRGRPLTRR